MLLDLFCGAGGAAEGYQRVGFYVVGVDIANQPRYCGDEFIQADALEYLKTADLSRYDAIHASPPCQGYSIMNNLPWLKGREYPLLILPIMEMLGKVGKPYVVENVMGARYGAKGLKKRGLEDHGLQAGWLCGTMFGLPFYRHRLFATNWFWLAPGHPTHQARIRPGHSLAGRARDIIFTPNRDVHQSFGVRAADAALSDWQSNGAQKEGVGIGHARGWRLAAEAMGIDWMKREELTQAIPPCYTEFLGNYLLSVWGVDGEK